MEYLILNEESIPFITLQDANEKFPVFITIVSEAFSNRFKAIRVSERIGKGWFEMLVCNNLALREWLRGKDKELERKIKSFISKTDIPQIPTELENISNRSKNCDFYLSEKPDQTFPSIGATYLLNQLSISYDSEIIWKKKVIEATKVEIINEKITEEIVTIKNVAEHNNWLEHFASIELQRKENLKKGNELWINKEVEFPNLIFCGKSEKNLKYLSVSDTIFSQLWNTLKTLDCYCQNVSNDYSLKSIKEKTKLDISDESDSIKQNPKLSIHRTFLVEGKTLFFGYHVKNFSGEMRLHFLPDPEKKKILIAYFGKHLPTKRDPK